MTPLFPAQRAAEEFAGVVEGSRVDVADRYAPLTATIGLLREQAPVTPQSGFTVDLRARLMSAADTLLLPAVPAQTARPRGRTASVTPLRNRHRLGTAAVAAFVVVAGSTGVAAAAQSALPGDTLYPIKLGIESAQSSFSLTDAGKGADQLSQASTRLGEVVDMARAGESASEIENTLAAFKNGANSGSDLLFRSYQRNGDSADVSKVRAFTAASLAELSEAARLAPSSSSDSFADAGDTLAAIDTQARTLCASCGGEALASPPDLSTVSSTTALTRLISTPNQNAVTHARNKRRAAKSAKAAETQAGQSANGSTPSTKPSTGSLPPMPTPQLPHGSSPGSGSLQQPSGGVTTLLGEVSKATGGLTDPLLNPLNKLISGSGSTLP